MVVRPRDVSPPDLPARPASRTHLVSWALVVGIAALVGVFSFSDTRKLWETASTLNGWALLIPLGGAFASYLFMALSYQGIARAAGATMSFWEMLKITFVANTVNYLVTTGGLSGFAVRMYFFIRASIAPGTAVIISMLQTFVTNVVLLFFVVLGFSYLLAAHEVRGFALIATVTLLSVFALTALLFVLLLFHRSLRRRTLFLTAELAHWFLRRFVPRHSPRRTRIWRFQRNLNRGLEFMLARKRRMVAPVFWIVIDWVVTLFILWGAFVAVRHPIPFSFVIVGFAVGIVLSLVSLVPAGLGIMEGSMAAVFAGLSVPFETAVVAVLIFRVAYYVMPMITSVFFFRGMLVQGAHAPEALEETGAYPQGIPEKQV
jgi:uncharacterized protein (TIRG00374 family)